MPFDNSLKNFYESLRFHSEVKAVQHDLPEALRRVLNNALDEMGYS